MSGLIRIPGSVGVVIVRLISYALTVAAGTTVLQRDVLLADGIAITIADTGELLIL